MVYGVIVIVGILLIIIQKKYVLKLKSFAKALILPFLSVVIAMYLFMQFKGRQDFFLDYTFVLACTLFVSSFINTLMSFILLHSK